MTLKTCFRCDWGGESDGPACPECGAKPLFVAAVAAPPKTQPKEQPKEQIPGPEPEQPAATETVVDAPSRSNRRLIVAFGLVALALVIAFLVANIDRPEPGLAADPVTPAATPSDSSSTTTPTPAPTPSGTSSTSGGLRPKGLRIGTNTVEVRAVTLSFDIPTSGWERFGDLFITKSSQGPQGAEAIIYWTGIGGTNGAHACGQWWGAPPGSIEDYAKAASKMSGADVVTGPSDVTLSGLTAAHVALIVRKSRGCDPGWFYRWPFVNWGAFWRGTEVGDSVRIWIVDVGRDRIYIEADTHENASRELNREVRQIVESIKLDSPSLD